MRLKTELYGYERFLQTGKVNDYLSYLAQNKGTTGQEMQIKMNTTGDTSALNDGRDCNPGIRG